MVSDGGVFWHSIRVQEALRDGLGTLPPTERLECQPQGTGMEMVADGGYLHLPPPDPEIREGLP